VCAATGDRARSCSEPPSRAPIGDSGHGGILACGFDAWTTCSLNVSERARSIAWYRDVLGLEQRGEARRDDWPVFMGEFGACVALFQAQVGPARAAAQSRPGCRHVAFMVGRDDLASRTDAAQPSTGVEFRFEDHGNAHSVYFPDPDGNVIELTLTTYEP
jgi:catechol 2,3-dioxygenase-like lactoylglutathione lyase family enzyme